MILAQCLYLGFALSPQIAAGFTPPLLQGFAPASGFATIFHLKVPLSWYCCSLWIIYLNVLITKLLPIFLLFLWNGSFTRAGNLVHYSPMSGTVLGSCMVINVCCWKRDARAAFWTQVSWTGKLLLPIILCPFKMNHSYELDCESRWAFSEGVGGSSGKGTPGNTPGMRDGQAIWYQSTFWKKMEI